MKEHQAEKKIKGFLTSPLRSPMGPPLGFAGDWLALAGTILYFTCVAALPWIEVRVHIGGLDIAKGKFGLFESPWAWALVVLGVLLVVGLWFVQMRGILTLAMGIFCWIFAIIFWVGVWKKIESIVGPIVRLARALPLFGPLIEEVLLKITKETLEVNVSWGYIFFIVAGGLLMTGGLLRYFLVTDSA